MTAIFLHPMFNASLRFYLFIPPINISGLFSFFNTHCVRHFRVNLYPREATTNARAIPVFPLVGSIISIPGFEYHAFRHPISYLTQFDILPSAPDYVLPFSQEWWPCCLGLICLILLKEFCQS